MSRVIAQWRRSQRLATSAMKLAISPVIAPRTTKATTPAEGTAEAAAIAADQTLNATNVARSVTLRGLAPMQPRAAMAAAEVQEARTGKYNNTYTCGGNLT
jgi:hypothetical protein